jgi:hypothetical protein
MANYDLNFLPGELYPGMPFLKAVPKTDKGNVLQGAKPGYGTNEVEAAKDFIRRNSTETLNKIWDGK